MKHFIWIDDERMIPECIETDVAFWAKSYDSAIDYILTEVDLSLDLLYISFDHDLGLGKTGYDIAKWLIANNYRGKYDTHSMNPVGAKNIQQLLDHYGWEYYPKHYK